MTVPSPRRGSAPLRHVLLTVLLTVQLLLGTVLAAGVARYAAQRRRGEAGNSTAEWVLIIAFVVGLVLAVTLIFRDKIMDAVNNINFTAP